MNHITLDQRSNEELRASIVGLHRRMCAAHRDLLAEIAEHDRRGACVDYGASSEESYLVAEFDVLWRTALDWVRTARALEHHPELGLAFAEGEISADQLGALIQVMEINKPDTTDPIGPFDGPAPDPPPAPDPDPAPNPDPAPDPAPDPDPGPSPDAAGDGEDPLQLAGRLSAAQLAAMARTLRSRSAAEAAAAHRRRRVKTHDIDGGAGVHVEADLFDDAAALFHAALDEHAKTIKADPETGRYQPLEQTHADALTEMASAWLTGRERATDRPAVFVHADATILAGDNGRAGTAYGPLAAETVRRLACHCHLTPVAEREGPDPLHLGRSQRLPTWQLSETVRHRDQGCRFPGCGRTRWTQTHHILEWDADHGPTDYENLCTLCRFHHHLVHEGRWKISGDPRHQLTFTSPDHHTTLTRWPNNTRRPPGDPPDPPHTAPPPDGRTGPSHDQPRPTLFEHVEA